eukprot:6195384-Pleurochrysis_carterae.AAC.2
MAVLAVKATARTGNGLGGGGHLHAVAKRKRRSWSHTQLHTNSHPSDTKSRLCWLQLDREHYRMAAMDILEVASQSGLIIRLAAIAPWTSRIARICGSQKSC